MCYERDRRGTDGSDALREMRARPLGIGLQEQVSNHRKLRELRALVVNVAGKGGAKLRQVRFKKTNASEPLMTCRNYSGDAETGTRTSVPRIRLGATCVLPSRRPA